MTDPAPTEGQDQGTPVVAATFKQEKSQSGEPPKQEGTGAQGNAVPVDLEKIRETIKFARAWRKGIIDSRELLELIATYMDVHGARSLIEARINEIKRKFEDQDFEDKHERESQSKALDRYKKVLESVKQNGEKVDSLLTEMQKSPDPEERAMAFDVRINLLRMESADLTNEISRYEQIKAQTGSPEAKAKCDAIIKKLTDKRNAIAGDKGEIAKLQQDKKVSCPGMEVDTVGSRVLQLREALNGASLSEEEARALLENPFGALETTLNEAIQSPQATKQFLAQLQEKNIVTKEQAAKLNETLTLAAELNKVIADERKATIVNFGLMLAIFAIIFAYVANTSSNRRGGGGVMM